MRRFFDTLNLLLMVGLVGFSLWAWSHLPERIPTHFGIDGRADGWSQKTPLSWFGLPGFACLLVLGMTWFRVLLPRKPHWVNLPDRRRLSDLPEAARPPVTTMFSGFLALVQTELLVIFGLIHLASYRTAQGMNSQGIMITVLILAILASPVLLVVFFLRLQVALDEGKRLADSAAEG